MYLEAAVAVAAGGYALSSLLPVRGVHDWACPGAIRRTASSEVCWTFDDGPHPELTPRVLDALAGAGQRATFFVVGERVRRHGDLVRRIRAEGHAVGNHTNTHAWLPGLSSSAIERQLVACQRAVEDATGESPALVRPPWGHRDARFYFAARRLGLVPVLWSLDSRDYLGLSGEGIRRRAARARGGDIVLFHDGNEKARAMPDQLATLAQLLQARGLVSEPLPRRAAAESISVLP